MSFVHCLAASPAYVADNLSHQVAMPAGIFNLISIVEASRPKSILTKFIVATLYQRSKVPHSTL